MLPVRRTVFNRLFQPNRIGKRLIRRFRRLKWVDPVLRFTMQNTRRSNQGGANQIIGRHAGLKTLIRYYIKFPSRIRRVSKPFTRRNR